MAAKSSFLDKVLGRLGRLDAEDVQKVVARLARERKFLETLFNTIEDGVMVVDGRGRVQYLNQSVNRLLGLPGTVAEGQPVTDFLPDLDWSKIAALESAGGQRVVRHEFEVSYPRQRFLRLFATALEGGPSGSHGVALILHDATEARQKTFEAIESERIQALTLLAASVAHEIGNPLNALHIHLQLMERELKKLRTVRAEAAPARAKTNRRLRPEAPSTTGDLDEIAGKFDQYLEVCKGEITRLDYIITQFLQAIRPSPPQLRPCQINEVVSDTLALLKPELDNRGLIVETRLGRALPAAALDAAQIKQVLVNLIKNSMQAMTRDGVLTLETGVAGDGIWASVGDTGGGIPQEQLNRVFEPFFTTKKKGSGLGLMIVQRIMREHRGRIEVESHQGKGTVFRLWLPLQGSRPRLLAAAPEAGEASA